MSKKIILITGTSSGFGNDTAKTLAEAGHQVFATMRGVSGKHSEKANELRSKGIEVLEVDVQNDASVEAGVKTLLQKTNGKLDVVINNAGLMIQGFSEAITTEQTRQMFDVNVLGVQRVLRAVLPQLRKNKSGLVINIGSILGRVTIPFLGLYGATKFAVEALTESYRYELSQLGVGLVIVQPGPFPTGLYAHLDAGDADRTKQYGDVVNVQKGFLDFVGGVFSSAEAPKPHDVAEAIVKLIATPLSNLPDRVVVGSAFGADAVNTAVKPIQAGLIDNLGMTALKTLKAA